MVVGVPLPSCHLSAKKRRYRGCRLARNSGHIWGRTAWGLWEGKSRCLVGKTDRCWDRLQTSEGESKARRCRARVEGRCLKRCQRMTEGRTRLNQEQAALLG